MQPKRFANILLSLLCLSAAAGGPALAQSSLMDIYQEALHNDPDIAAAWAERQAGQEAAKQGLAGLLPIVNAQASYNPWAETERTIKGGNPPTQNFNYTSYTAYLTLKQPLFRAYNWADYVQSKIKVNYSDAVFAAKWQALIARTTTAYLNVLRATEFLKLAKAHKQTFAEQLAQVTKLYEGGEGTITDIDESKSRYDLAQAQEIQAANDVNVANYEIQRLIGHVPTGPLAAVNPSRLQLIPPDPADMTLWEKGALAANPTVLAAKLSMDTAEQEIKKSFAGHYPTLDLVATKAFSSSDTNITINQTYDSAQVGVQMSLPLFTGGYTSSKVREAEAKMQQAREQYESVQRKTSLDVKQAYLNIVKGIAEVRAYRQAIQSGEHSLISTKKSVTAGLRTNVDVLNAEEILYQSKRNLVDAQSGYINNWIQLKNSAGTLTEEDIAHVNTWMSD